jgi:hypothetical protein
MASTPPLVQASPGLSFGTGVSFPKIAYGLLKKEKVGLTNLARVWLIPAKWGWCRGVGDQIAEE